MTSRRSVSFDFVFRANHAVVEDEGSRPRDSPVPMTRYVGPIENDFIDGFIVGSPNFLILIPVRTFTCGLTSGFRISSDELNIAVINP